MTRDELSEALEVAPKTITAWVRAGLPHTRRGRAYQFDPSAVRAWLIQQGIAHEDRPTVDTRAEVASHFGVNERTVAVWLAAGCPGEHGRYDLTAIANWRATNRPESNPESSHRVHLLEIKAAREQLQLDEARRQLLPLEPTLRWAQRVANEIRSRLDQLPDLLIAHQPPKTPRRQLNQLRDRLRRTIDDCLNTLAEAVADLDPIRLDPGATDDD